MAHKIELEADENLIFQDGINSFKHPMVLGVTDRAVFIAREQHLRLSSWYLHRIPLHEVEQVNLRKERGPRVWIWSAAVFLTGLILTLGVIVTAYQEGFQWKPGVMTSIGGPVMILVGLLTPYLARGRRILQIETKGRRYEWKPNASDDRAAVNRMQEGFLWACRCVGIRTRRLDMLTRRETAAFWKWFGQNQNRLEESDQQAIELVRARINKLVGGLAPELRRVDDQRVLVVSADGVRDMFPIVEEVVSRAPEISGWKFVAFRPPASGPVKFRVGETEYRTNEMYFMPLSNGFDLAIVVFADWGWDMDDFEPAFVAVQNVLGEYDSATKVHHYDFRNIDEADDETDLRPLAMLPEFVADFHRLTSN